MARQRLAEWLCGSLGRLAGIGVGAAVAGFPGLAGGFAAGYMTDVGVRRFQVSGRAWRAHLPQYAERQFITATCAIMGHVAKADGRVSEAEIRVASEVFELLELDGDLRPGAIRLFQRGKRHDFPLAWVLARFARACRDDEEMLRTFLEYQVAVAAADGFPSPAQQALLERLVRRLGFSVKELPRMLRGYRGGPGALRAMPQSPFRVLGVAESATPEQVRHAYRKLISRYPPDRLQAQGCSDREVRAGANRTHAARRAYDQIRRQKGF